MRFVVPPVVQSSLLAMFATGSAATLVAQPTHVIAQAGDQFTFRSQHKVVASDRFTRSTDLTFDFKLTVRAVREDGAIEAVIKWSRVSGRGGSLLEGREFDTDGASLPPSETVHGELVAALREFITKEQPVVYDATGKVLELPEFDDRVRRTAAKAASLARIMIPGLLNPAAMRDRLRVFCTVPKVGDQPSQAWLGRGNFANEFAGLGELRHQVTSSTDDEFSVTSVLASETQPTSPATGAPAEPTKAAASPSSSGLHGFAATVTATAKGVVRTSRLEGTVRREVPYKSKISITESRVTQTIEQVDSPAQKPK